MRIASPQSPEDAEALREHAAAFIAERYPAPGGPDPDAIGDRAEYDTARETAAAQASARFHEAFPGIELNLATATSAEGLLRLAQGASDLHCGGNVAVGFMLRPSRFPCPSPSLPT